MAEPSDAFSAKLSGNIDAILEKYGEIFTKIMNGYGYETMWQELLEKYFKVDGLPEPIIDAMKYIFFQGAYAGHQTLKLLVMNYMARSNVECLERADELKRNSISIVCQLEQSISKANDEIKKILH